MTGYPGSNPTLADKLHSWRKEGCKRPASTCLPVEVDLQGSDTPFKAHSQGNVLPVWKLKQTGSINPECIPHHMVTKFRTLFLALFR